MTFSRFSWITLVVILLVVVAGSVVRMTGSGMGCPDWPKCFGQAIPPTDISELPADYKEHYSAIRAKKIERFAVYLEKLGFDATAAALRADESMLVESDFNPWKTWTEYANRLVGAISGLLVLITFVWSWRKLKTHPLLPILATIQLVVLLFQAWMGSIVVATNLLPWVLTIHMLLALLIVGIQLGIIQTINSAKPKVSVHKRFKQVLIVAVALSTAQILLGSQVRQEIDAVAKILGESMRGDWIESIGLLFKVHRSFAILVMATNLFLAWYAYKFNYGSKAVFILAAVVVAEAITGIILTYGGMIAAFQPVHMVFAAVMFTLQAYLLLNTKSTLIAID